MEAHEDRVPGKKSIDAQALAFALRCGLSDLKKAALKRVQHAVEQNPGATTKIAVDLGLSLNVYQRLVNEVQEVCDLHYGNRPDVIVGRTPAVLMRGKKKSASKNRS